MKLLNRGKDYMKENAWLVFFSLILSAVITVGRKINVQIEPYFKSFQYGDLFLFILLFIVFCFLIDRCTHYIGSHPLKVSETNITRRYWLKLFIIFLIAWSPYLLVYYPGILTPDSINSLLQAENLAYLYNHTPVAYTLLVTLFARIGWFLGDKHLGIFFFSCAQSIMMSAALSYAVYWLRKRGCPKWVAVMVSVFFAANPVIAIHSITMWKDILFSAWSLLTCLLLYDIGRGKGTPLGQTKGLLSLLACFFLLSFGRNNGIYIVFLIFLVLTVSYKKYRKRLLIIGGGVYF